MKIQKDKIHLSPLHPSLAILLPPEKLVMNPVVVGRGGTLIDGYRRYQLCADYEIEAVEMEGDLFQTAVSLNFRTRKWDEAECFLWTRWARSLGADPSVLLRHQFADDLFDAEDRVITALAAQKITFRQFLFLRRTPSRHRNYLQSLLEERIALNGNETASFLEMSIDLISVLEKKEVEDVFREEALASVLRDPGCNPRQRGENLLKQMRNLRYPYYTKKLKEFSSNWVQLKIEPVVQVKKNLFLERGALELSLSATSYDELKSKVLELQASLSSPHWKKIWEI
jgi:hypothetical protein